MPIIMQSALMARACWSAARIRARCMWSIPRPVNIGYLQHRRDATRRGDWTPWAIGPHGRWGLAVSAGTDSVAVIDVKNLKLAKVIKVGKTPHNARFSKDGKLAYVTLQGGNSVAVIAMQSLSKVDEIPVPGIEGPHNLDISADGSVPWARGIAGKVAAVDIKTGEAKMGTVSAWQRRQLVVIFGYLQAQGPAPRLLNAFSIASALVAPSMTCRPWPLNPPITAITPQSLYSFITRNRNFASSVCSIQIARTQNS